MKSAVRLDTARLRATCDCVFQIRFTVVGLPAGDYRIRFGGEHISSGVYLCRLRADGESRCRLIMLAR